MQPTWASSVVRPLNTLTVLAALLALVAVGLEEPPLALELSAPDGLLEGDAEARLVRHPWPIGRGATEVGDGVELEVRVNSDLLNADGSTVLHVGVFSFSFSEPEDVAAAWMAEGGWPSPSNPLQMTSVFAAYLNAGAKVGGAGDACFGDDVMDFCVRALGCLALHAPERGGRGELRRYRVAAGMPFASNYRVEAYITDAPSSSCLRASAFGRSSVWWPHAVSELQEGIGFPGLRGARQAAMSRFRLLHVAETSWWWSVQAQVKPAEAWSDMMVAALELASRSAVARGGGGGDVAGRRRHCGLWLEFGVASGKSASFISKRMKNFCEGRATLDAFDSFQGLPSAWAHTDMGEGAFSQGGQVPERLRGLDNIAVHVGLFSETLSVLDGDGDGAVAFAHVDVDIYPSAVEVLSRIACRLHAGSVLVFDELVNYVGFERSGEHRAWQYVAHEFRIHWRYVGIFWQQAVPVVILSRGEACSAG